MFFNAKNCGAVKKGVTRHCSWGTCKSDSRFKQKLPEGTGFVRFAKPGKLKDDLTKAYFPLGEIFRAKNASQSGKVRTKTVYAFHYRQRSRENY